MRGLLRAAKARLFDPMLTPPAVTRIERGGRSIRVEVIDLLSASPARLSDLRAQMMQVQRASYRQATHGAIAGVDLDARLRAHVDDSIDTAKYAVYNTAVMFGEPGDVLGMAHGHVQRIDVDGTSVEVIRASTNILPAARGLRLTSIMARVLIQTYARDHLRAAGPRYYAGYCMGPVMFRFMYDRVPHIVPGPRADSTPRTTRVYDALFGERVDANGVLPEHAGSRVTEQTRAWIQAHRNHPAAAFFLARNPRFADGFTLPVLVRLTARDLVTCVLRSARIEVRRALRPR